MASPYTLLPHSVYIPEGNIFIPFSFFEQPIAIRVESKYSHTTGCTETFLSGDGTSIVLPLSEEEATEMVKTVMNRP